MIIQFPLKTKIQYPFHKANQKVALLHSSVLLKSCRSLKVFSIIKFCRCCVEVQDYSPIIVYGLEDFNQFSAENKRVLPVPVETLNVPVLYKSVLLDTCTHLWKHSLSKCCYCCEQGHDNSLIICSQENFDPLVSTKAKDHLPFLIVPLNARVI